MDVTFSTFLGQIVSNPVLAVTVILALGAIFVNGWTDAPNAIATCVTTRCMPARAAILMSAAFNFLGVLIMTHFNASVANTISHIVDFGGNSTMALACLCAALFSINVHEWMKVIYGLALSIGLGFVMGWVLCKLVSILFVAANRRRANVFFKYAQIASAAAMSFMHGAQDGQKFIGVLFLGVAFASGQTSVGDAGIPIWIMLLCSATMGIGTSVGGERIIKSVGQSMVKLEKYQGFSADLAGAANLLLATLTGIPVSSTHIKTCAIMGVGAVKRLSAINFGVVKDMMFTWFFTFPACGLISFVMAKLFMMFL